MIKCRQGGTLMRLRIILLPLVVIISISLLSCTTTLEQVSSIDISFDDFQINHEVTKEIEIGVGDTFTVTLASNPTTGFKWPEFGRIVDETILKQVDHEYQPPESDVLGASGKESWTFEALKKGKTAISMEYSQPWEGGIQAEWTFSVDVFVK